MNFLRNEAGSPTIENIIWIAVFVVAMIAIIALITSTMKKTSNNALGVIDNAVENATK